MKLSIFAILSTVAVSSAFAPATFGVKQTTALNAEAEQSRKAFLSAAGLAVFGAAVSPAFAMDQENVSDPTEQWETGKPTPAAASARLARFTNARTQLTSNYPPIKRLTLERKSPVVSSTLGLTTELLFDFPVRNAHVFRYQTRLDINAPNFEAYKRTYPGLFK